MSGLATQSGMLSGLGGDPDAEDYFARISAAGSSISPTNKAAVTAFVVSCKDAGIWSAIKCFCFLAGPDDLVGALVPLVGPAPSNNGFQETDYTRNFGLKGDDSSNLGTNWGQTQQLIDNIHAAVYMPENPTKAFAFALGNEPNDGGTTIWVVGSSYMSGRVHSGTRSDTNELPLGFCSSVRNSPGVQSLFTNNTKRDFSVASTTVLATNFHVFSRSNGGFPYADTLSLYSLGEYIDPAIFDPITEAYMSAIV